MIFFGVFLIGIAAGSVDMPDSFPSGNILTSTISDSVPQQTHDVLVGASDTASFQPQQITAHVGDTIRFRFWSGNRTIRESSFNKPCIASTESDAGFYHFISRDISMNSGTPYEEILVTRTSPQWFFCEGSPSTGCSKDVVFAINPGSFWEEFIRRAEPQPDQTSAIGAPLTSTPVSVGIGSPVGKVTVLPNASGCPLGFTLATVGVIAPVGSPSQVVQNPVPFGIGVPSQTPKSLETPRLTFRCGPSGVLSSLSSTTTIRAIVTTPVDEYWSAATEAASRLGATCSVVADSLTQTHFPPATTSGPTDEVRTESTSSSDTRLADFSGLPQSTIDAVPLSQSTDTMSAMLETSSERVALTTSSLGFISETESNASTDTSALATTSSEQAPFVAEYQVEFSPPLIKRAYAGVGSVCVGPDPNNGTNWSWASGGTGWLPRQTTPPGDMFINAGSQNMGAMLLLSICAVVIGAAL